MAAANSLFKKFLFTAISTFLAYQSTNLVLAMVEAKASDFGLGSQIFIAVFASMCFTGTTAFVGFVLPTHKMLPNSYYSINQSVFLLYFYNTLGVKHFRFLLLKVFWGKPKKKREFFNGKRNGIKQMVYQTKQAEFGHLIPFIVLSVFGFYLLINGLKIAAGITLVLNIIGNLYPTILQRYHRYRISKLKKAFRC